MNNRKEFFSVTIDEIAEALSDQQVEIEITKVAEAEEYRKSLAAIREREKTEGVSEKLELEIPDVISDLLRNQ